MNPSTLPLLLCITLSSLTLKVLASDQSLTSSSSDSSEYSSPLGKRTILHVNSAEENEEGHESKSPTRMSPGTEAFVIEAARLMSVRSPLIVGAGSSSEADQYDEQLESFLAQNSAVSSSVKGSESIDDVSVSVTRDINISLPPDFKTPILPPVSIFTETEVDYQAQEHSHEKATQRIQVQQVEQIRKIERDFWYFIFIGDWKNVGALLRYDPKFAPSMSNFVFEKMVIIMTHPGTTVRLLKFLYGKFPFLFNEKYPNREYIFSIMHPDHVRTLLEVFPNCVKLRITLLDEFVNNIFTDLDLDEAFFNFIINNKKMLKSMYMARPDLFLDNYHKMPAGIFKRNLPQLVYMLNTMISDERIRMAHFKIAAINNESPFDSSFIHTLDCAKNHSTILEIIDYLLSFPASLITEQAIKAVISNNDLYMILQNHTI